MHKYILLLILPAIILLSGCTKVNGGGTIKEQGITSYQYGTHTIEIDGTIYAIRSNTVNLDDYIDQYVTVNGEKVNGYPMDGGPELLEITSVE